MGDRGTEGSIAMRMPIPVAPTNVEEQWFAGCRTPGLEGYPPPRWAVMARTSEPSRFLPHVLELQDDTLGRISSSLCQSCERIDGNIVVHPLALPRREARHRVDTQTRLIVPTP